MKLPWPTAMSPAFLTEGSSSDSSKTCPIAVAASVKDRTVARMPKAAWKGEPVPSREFPLAVVKLLRLAVEVGIAVGIIEELVSRLVIKPAAEEEV